MKIGIISDTHGDYAIWKKVMGGPLLGVDLLLHAGDILYHGPRNPLAPGYDPGALAADIAASNPVPVLAVKGNCDSEVDEMVLGNPLAQYRVTDEGGWRLLLHHGHGFTRKQAFEVAKAFRCRLIISGHTHIPLLEEEEGMIFLNPGSPTLPKGEGIPTVALLNGERVQVIRIDTGAVIMEKPLN